MKKIVIIAVLLLAGTNLSKAQFSIDKFFSVDLNSSLASVKTLFPNEKWEERDRNDNKIISFYSWLEPNSIRVSFTFTENGVMRLKSLSNGKRDPESAKKFYEQMKEIAIKQFGTSYDNKDFMGTSFLIWKSNNDIVITLSIKEERSSLAFLKADGIPFF